MKPPASPLAYLLAFIFALTLIDHQRVIGTSDHPKGWIEIYEGQRIVHLGGTPYEIGYQHGSLLKEEIGYNIHRLISTVPRSEDSTPTVYTYFMEALPKIIPYLPEDLVEEMHGVADGAGVSYKQILLLNLFPEMFHCVGITANNKATKDGILYHVRVLDYDIAQDIQDTAILAVVKPEKGIPFLNITYAGFIGCVTGMNAEKISIGEVGGKGYGYWEGIPMSLLLRHILQYCSSLKEISSYLAATPRTCEYYYLFADGKENRSLGIYASNTRLSIISPGERYKKIPFIPDAYDPLFIDDLLFKATYKGTFFDHPEDCIVILRNGYFDLLIERLNESYGHITVDVLKNAVKEPIAKSANLHNAIFAPASLDVWVSHAGEYGEPACEMPYVHHNLNELLGR